MVPPGIEGARYVGNQACASCHEEITRNFPGSVHSRYFREEATPGRAGGCESCHGAGSLHIEAARDKDRHIFNPGRDPAPCLDCHLEVGMQFQLPRHHALPEGLMNCIDCHDPHQREIFKRSDPFGSGPDPCLRCHTEQARNFLFVHEAMQEGCTLCHRPHGSIHDKLLILPDANLCLRCHAETGMGEGILMGKTDHSAFLRMGSCWTAGCHTAVHGSMVSPRLLH